MKVEIIRHGLTKYSEEHRYLGLIDAPLSLRGREELCPRAFPEKVYVSRLMRTKETAEIIYPGAVRTEMSGLGEMDFGEFDGRTCLELSSDRRYQEWVDGYCTGECPGGESRQSFTDRVTAAFSLIMDREMKMRTNSGSRVMGGTVYLVVHGGTIMSVMDRYAGGKQDYFSWLPPCGCGYLLDADRWQEEHVLQVLEKVDCRKPAKTWR